MAPGRNDLQRPAAAKPANVSPWKGHHERFAGCDGESDAGCGWQACSSGLFPGASVRRLAFSLL